MVFEFEFLMMFKPDYLFIYFWKSKFRTSIICVLKLHFTDCSKQFHNEKKFQCCKVFLNTKKLKEIMKGHFSKDQLIYLCVFSQDGMLVFGPLLNDFLAQICNF